jgi:membrane carboxypeptidase/penicillin-binding protein
VRLVLKICLALLVVAVSVPVAALAWLFFYSRGLPDLESLASFAPEKTVTLTDSCLKSPTVVVPFDAMGSNVQKALGATEGNESDGGILSSLLEGFLERHSSDRPSLSFNVTRTALCGQTGHRTAGQYKLDSLRFTAQLERRFSGRQLFTILANRIYFGEGQYGVAAAAQHYFKKEPEQLSVAEAALIAGLPRAPSKYEPRKHPDVALERRNQVIDEMVAAHLITESVGSASKAIPLSVVTAQSQQ